MSSSFNTNNYFPWQGWTFNQTLDTLSNNMFSTYNPFLITSLTTPNPNIFASSGSNSGYASLYFNNNSSNNLLSSFNTGYSYCNNYSKYGCANGYDYQMDIYYNQQANGILFPSKCGPETNRYADILNVRNMENTFGWKNGLHAIFSQAAEEGFKKCFTNLIEGCHIV